MEEKMPIKVEFKTTIKYNEQYWFTEVNGSFVSNSLSYDKEKAYNLFLDIINKQGFTTKTETLETKLI